MGTHTGENHINVLSVICACSLNDILKKTFEDAYQKDTLKK